MPSHRGHDKGHAKRGGGRPPGGKNKATLERERVAAEIAARTMADARVAGKKLAKEVLEEFMLTFAGMAAHYQFHPRVANVNADEARFKEYANLAIDCAHKLAPYQSPSFRAVNVFVGPEPKTIEGREVEPNVFSIDDPVALSKVYRRLIAGSRS